MSALTQKKFQADLAKMWSEAVHAEYKAQIAAAVLAEREACWRMAENYDTGYEAAAAIRARGQA